MTACKGYPLELQVKNFDLLHDLRYSCGWRIESDQPEHLIRYKYEIFGINMTYDMVRLDLD